MKKILFLLLFTFTFSCSTDIDESKIFLFNNIYFQLENKESFTELTKENTDLYFNLIDNNDLQAPLYKYITGDGYQLFIGLPIATDFNSIKNSISDESIVSGSLDDKSSRYVYLNFNKDKKNITKYLLEIDKNLVYIILTSDTDEKLSVSEIENITKRIIKE